MVGWLDRDTFELLLEMLMPLSAQHAIQQTAESKRYKEATLLLLQVGT
jgi:hypothetical protein